MPIAIPCDGCTFIGQLKGKNAIDHVFIETEARHNAPALAASRPTSPRAPTPSASRRLGAASRAASRGLCSA
eukprot:29024-Pelagococcus_subviridis.AAC.5